MSTGIIIVVIIILIIIVDMLINVSRSKIDFLKKREQSKKISAEVVEYRKERISSMRNDYTEIEYPYVKLDIVNDDKYETSIRKLRYASSWGRSFKIGQKINVFWYGGDLLYWNPIDDTIIKYLPKKWNILTPKE